ELGVDQRGAVLRVGGQAREPAQVVLGRHALAAPPASGLVGAQAVGQRGRVLGGEQRQQVGGQRARRLGHGDLGVGGTISAASSRRAARWGAGSFGISITGRGRASTARDFGRAFHLLQREYLCAPLGRPSSRAG